MVEYKLTVVKTSDGEYLVNWYHKVPDIKVKNFDDVLAYIGRTDKDILKVEPTLIGLTVAELTRVRKVRSILLNLESSL